MNVSLSLAGAQFDTLVKTLEERSREWVAPEEPTDSALASMIRQKLGGTWIPSSRPVSLCDICQFQVTVRNDKKWVTKIGKFALYRKGQGFQARLYATPWDEKKLEGWNITCVSEYVNPTPFSSVWSPKSWSPASLC